METRNGLPFATVGVPATQVSFSGGRVCADLAAHGGFTHIRYFGAQPLGRSEFFTADPISAWTQLFRLFVEIDGKLHYAEFHDTTFLPFGYQSRCVLDGVEIVHDLLLLNDALTVSAQVAGGAEGRSVRFKWQVAECCVHKDFPGRSWSEFVVDANLLRCQVVDANPASSEPESLTQVNGFGTSEPESAATFIGVTADCPLEFYQTPRVFAKTYLSSPVGVDHVLFALLFARGEAALFARAAADLAAERQEVLRRFQSRLETQPQIELGDATVDSFLRCAAPIIDSLQVADIPGGYRAADSGYWIWGWDSLVHADAMLMAGLHSELAAMLRFYRDTAHPEKGVFHALSCDGKPLMAMAPAAQCLYGVTLYHYFSFSRDLATLAELYPFVTKLLDRALAMEVEGCGLVSGVSLYPDFPEHLGQTGDDISSFNNSVLYQALRCVSALAGLLGERADAERFQQAADKLRSAFNRLLFDDSLGYYHDSIAVQDFSPRRHSPVYAILDVSPFALELAADKLPRVAAFMRAKFPQRLGLSMFPRDDNAFMRDGNQLGMYMPVVEGFHRRAMTAVGDVEAAMGFLAPLRWAWGQLSAPEALTCEAVNHGLTLDNPGRKQGFCVKSWYSLLLRLGLGLEVNPLGLRLSAPLMPGPRLVLENLRVGAKLLSLEVEGEGREIDRVELNGAPLDALALPYGALAAKNRLTVRRK